jgi:hypothetical protein
MTRMRRDWNVPVPEDTPYFMVNTLPEPAIMAIRFLHPCVLPMLERLRSYEMNSRPSHATEFRRFGRRWSE